jgi:tetratricopeptide (TPR) repeat protein
MKKIGQRKIIFISVILIVLIILGSIYRYNYTQKKLTAEALLRTDPEFNQKTIDQLKAKPESELTADEKSKLELWNFINKNSRNRILFFEGMHSYQPSGIFEQIANLNPGPLMLTGILFKLAGKYERDGKPEKALATRKRIIRILESLIQNQGDSRWVDASVYHMLAVCYKKLPNRTEADNEKIIACYKKVLDNPARFGPAPSIKQSLGIFYGELGRYPEAIKLLEEVDREHSKYPTYTKVIKDRDRFYIAQAWARQGNKKKAKPVLEEIAQNHARWWLGQQAQKELIAMQNK